MQEQKVTNLSYLNEITGGESEILIDFIQLFFEQIPEFRDGLQEHLKNKNWRELGELAHKAKSSVMTFGMNDLGHNLKELQLKTQNEEDIETYTDYVDEFVDLINKAEKELKEEINNLK